MFVPAEVRLTGPEVDWAQVEGYLETAIGRVAALGGQAIVFGSGGARRVPDGSPRIRPKISWCASSDWPGMWPFTLT